MSDLKCLRILYVEDDDDTREVLSRYLKSRVGKITTASTGEEGLQKFFDYRPNLLIVDLILPGMSGLEMIGEVRKNDRDCRIIVTSTVNEIKTILDAVDLRIDHYVVKPTDTEDLERKMAGIAQDIIVQNKKLNVLKLDNFGLAEDMIRRECLKILKTYAGKGPMDLKILLIDNQVELIVMDAVTVMEKTIASNKRNISFVEQYRKLFYDEISNELEKCAENAIGCKARMTSIKVDGAKRIDKVILTIDI